MSILYNLRRKINKLEKMLNISLFFIFPFRFFHFLLENLLLNKNSRLSQCCNYFLDFEKIEDKNLTIISAGVGLDMSFEEKIFNEFNVKFIILIDPGEESKNLVSSKKDFFFEKAAIYNESKKMKIYKVSGNKNMSLENLFNTNEYILTNTITVSQIIKKYNLKELDILKLDVEGVADIVIKDCLKRNIFPSQICFELERPINLFKQFNYFRRFISLISMLKKYEYKLYNCTNLKLGLRSEILAVKNVVK